MTENHRRWREAGPKLAMALSEAGYPSDWSPGVILDSRVPGHAVDGIYFRGSNPPDDVIRKAFEVCGIADLWPFVYGKSQRRIKLWEIA